MGTVQDPAADAALSPGRPFEALRKVIRKKAMDLLMRREHTLCELTKKLCNKDYPADLVDEVVTLLEEEGLVSDARFTEAFVRYRASKGQGPQRIQTELRERGVDEKIQAAYLDARDPKWLQRAAQVRCKRFGEAPPGDFKERARQARFLQYRGFTADQVREVLDDDWQG